MTADPPGDDPDARIARHRARFDELVRRAEARLARPDLESAAVYAQVAAALAWHSPTGLHASPRLEALLAAIGRAMSATSGRVTAPAGAAHPGAPPGRETVLHVLTTAYGVGGHTRLAWRWIELDAERRHSVALTRQGLEPVPDSLIKTVEARGGEVHRVDRASARLTERAAALRALAADADVVVLHLHPFDVVPSIALSGLAHAGRRPPTILLNHADHLFWLGIDTSDVVAHLRTSGARLSAERRSLPAERSAILPVPLEPVRSAVDRAAARRLLGVADDDVLSVSIASSYKFAARAGAGLLPVFGAGVAALPNLRVLAVGPGDRRDWREAERSTAGRIRATGIRSDLETIYGAADLYVDSSPFSSLTSMLEAGQRGLPLLSFNEAGPEADVLAFDDPATDGLGVRTRTPAAFGAALAHLVEDPAARAERGQEIADVVAREHEGAAWLERLERVYAKAHAVNERSPQRRGPEPGRPVTAPAVDETRPSDELDRGLLAILDGQQEDSPRGIRGHLRYAPFRVRLEEWRDSRTSPRPLSILVLLPERIVMLARRAAILARGRRRRSPDRTAPGSTRPTTHGGEPR